MNVIKLKNLLIRTTAAVIAFGIAAPAQAAIEPANTLPFYTTYEEIMPTEASEVQAILDLVNAERAKARLAPLQLHADLSKMATVKAEDLRDNNYFAHESPIYGSPFEMMTAFGIRYSYAGENIAAGQRSPEEVMEAWMASPGHRANILNANYTHLGIGIAKGGSFGTYWVQAFLKP